MNIFKFREMEFRKRKFEYVNGESFMYLGRDYSMQIMVDNTIKSLKLNYTKGNSMLKAVIKTNIKSGQLWKIGIGKNP